MLQVDKALNYVGVAVGPEPSLSSPKENVEVVVKEVVAEQLVLDGDLEALCDQYRVHLPEENWQPVCQLLSKLLRGSRRVRKKGDVDVAVAFRSELMHALIAGLAQIDPELS